MSHTRVLNDRNSRKISVIIRITSRTHHAFRSDHIPVQIVDKISTEIIITVYCHFIHFRFTNSWNRTSKHYFYNENNSVNVIIVYKITKKY